jgi:hypothetical protein
LGLGLGLGLEGLAQVWSLIKQTADAYLLKAKELKEALKKREVEKDS